MNDPGSLSGGDIPLVREGRRKYPERVGIIIDRFVCAVRINLYVDF